MNKINVNNSCDLDVVRWSELGYSFMYKYLVILIYRERDREREYKHIHTHICSYPFIYIYRVIQEESALLWEMIV
jgi:hypothetical protein